MCEVMLVSDDGQRHEQFDIVGEQRVSGHGAAVGQRVSLQNARAIAQLMAWLEQGPLLVGDRVLLCRRVRPPVAIEEPPFHNALSQDELRALGVVE